MKMPGHMAAEVLRHLIKKPATLGYPFVPVKLPSQFRGKMVFIAEKCVGCKLCVKDCPARAIEITKVGDKRFKCEFDLDRCIYCGQCVDSCNKDAIVASEEFELASLTRGTLHITFEAPPAPAASKADEKPVTVADPKP